MKLHEVIEYILAENSNRGLTSLEIANIINKEKLYRRKDGGNIPPIQVNARVLKYPNIFSKKNDGLIYRVNGLQKDIISEAVKMNFILRKLLFHIGMNNTHVDVFVPFIFFYKGVIDRENLLDGFLKIKTKTGFNLNDLYEFANEMDLSSTPFYQKLNGIKEVIKDIINTKNSKNFNINLDKLNRYDFSTISIHEFGKVFSELILAVQANNIRGSQYSTPSGISYLIGKIINKNVHSGAVLYNPCTGYNSISTYINRNISNNFIFYGEELEQNAFILGLMNLLCSGVNIGEYKREDSLCQDNNEFADIVVSDPPYTGRTQSMELEKRYPVKTREIILLFIQRAVDALKEGGIGVVIVPEGFLFNSSKTYKKLRQYLIENNLIESIISLPVGILQPYTGIKVSLLVISKRKNKEVLIIDTDSSELSRSNGSKIILNTKKIIEIYNSTVSENMVSEPQSYYGRKIFDRISISQIQQSDFTLNIKRYLLHENDNDGLVPLSDIIEIKRSLKKVHYDKIPYVNIKDLNTDINDISLNESILNNVRDNQKGVYLDSPSILIGSIPPRMKPTYFKAKKSHVLVSPNVYVFQIKEEIEANVDIEYLIFELRSKKVIEQFDAFATGVTSLRRIRRPDFLKIKVRIPDTIKEQKEIVATKKEALYTSMLIEADKFADKIGVTKIEEKQLLGFIKHEVGNITPGISTDINNLKMFLTDKIDFDEKISKRKGAASIIDVFARLQSNVNDVETLLKSIENIIHIGSDNASRKNIEFIKYFNSEIEKQSYLLKQNNIRVYLGIEDNYAPKVDKNILIDTNQFSYLIRNFIINSVKHAYKNSIKDRIIVINMSEDKDYFYLSLINNGDPFPDGFSLNDFLSFGGRVENNKGSGLGGFLMGKIVKNHNGFIDLMTPGTTLLLNNENSETGFISNNSIKVGLHLLIKLPKE